MEHNYRSKDQFAQNWLILERLNFTEIFNVYIENLSFHSILLPP